MNTRILFVAIISLFFLFGCGNTNTKTVSNKEDSLKHLFPFSRDGKIGFIDISGKIVVQPQYDDFNSGDVESQQFIRVLVGDRYDGGKWGMLDRDGGVIIPTRYDVLGMFDEGLAYVKVGRKWGFLDKTGKMAINPTFDNAHPFSEGMAAVETGGKYGFIDKTGKMVIPPKFDYSSWFKNGMAAISMNKKQGYIDKKGNTLIEPQYYMASRLDNGMFKVVTPDKKMGIIDRNGKVVLDFLYDSISFYEDDALCLFQYTEDGKYGLLDLNTKKIITAPIYEDIHLMPANGLMGVVKDKKWGFIDLKTGTVVIEPQFQYAGPFFKSFGGNSATVKVDNKMGLIDKTGKIIVKPIYDYILEEEKFDLWLVELKGMHGFMDRTGKIMIEMKFTDARGFKRGLAKVKMENGGEWHYIDRTGKTVANMGKRNL